MRPLRRVILLLVAALLLLLAVALAGRNFILKAMVPAAIRAVTGFEASMESVSVGLIRGRILIRDLRVSNPPDFPDRRLLHAPQVLVEYKAATLLKRRREFPVVKLHVEEVVVVKNARGESNVARWMAAGNGDREGGGGGSSGETAENRFGTLDLRLGRVVYVDYTKMSGDRPFTKMVTLNFHGVYRNVSDRDLRNLLMLETLRQLPGRLPDITAEAVRKDLGEIGRAGAGVATNLAGAASQVVRGLEGLFSSTQTNRPPRGR